MKLLRRLKSLMLSEDSLRFYAMWFEITVLELPPYLPDPYLYANYYLLFKVGLIFFGGNFLSDY